MVHQETTTGASPLAHKRWDDIDWATVWYLAPGISIRCAIYSMQAVYLPEQNCLCYPLSDHQWASLELARHDKFAGQIAMHIEVFFPELCLAEPSLEVAKLWGARAMTLGFETEIDLYFFCNINGYLGEEGYLQPEHREIGALVSEPNQQTPSQRIKRAAQLAEQQAALV